jgi:hypothetical protein
MVAFFCPLELSGHTNGAVVVPLLPNPPVLDVPDGVFSVPDTGDSVELVRVGPNVGDTDGGAIHLIPE